MTMVNKPFGDIITFSRASGGGRFNSSGVYEWVGSNVPRFDYDPVTLQPLGLLIEEARTNLMLRSEEFNDPGWMKNSSTVSPNVVAAPNGMATADKLVEDSASAEHLVRRNITNSVGDSVSGSVFLKAAERTHVQLRINNSSTTSSSVVVVVNLLTGTLSGLQTTGDYTGGKADIKALPGGWFRVTVSAWTVSTASTMLRISLHNGSTASYLGDGASGAYLWGAQMEIGYESSSYIPTEASQVTRAADVASVNTSSPWYNASEGTFEVSARGIVGQSLLTAGSAVITADSAALKDYSISYTTDPAAMGVVIGLGRTSSIKYFPRSNA